MSSQEDDDSPDRETDDRPMSNIVLDEPQLHMTATVRHLSSTLFSSFNSSRFRLSSTRGGSLASSSHHTGDILINATLVEPVEVAEAEPEGFCQKHAKVIGSVSFIFLVAFVAFVSFTYNRIGMWGNTLPPTLAPSSVPSMAPSFDLRPTLEIVQERGSVRCGLNEYHNKGSFRYQLCQAIAAVAVNDQNAIEKVNRTAKTRFIMLRDRTVDVLTGSETYTIEREVNEPTTGSSFTFSTPYYYDGLVFAGNQTFISCAKEQKRYGECSKLLICVIKATTDFEYLSTHLARDFLVISTGVRESLQLWSSGKCNVVANGRLRLLNFQLREGEAFDSAFVIDNETFNNDPLSFVTRPDDTEWSNIVNWALQSLFYGERQGIGKDESKCQKNTETQSLNGTWSELNFLNAVYCVGNYQEIYESSELANYTRTALRTAINTINNGTPMLYVIPYGNLDNANDKMFLDLSVTYAVIKKDNKLKCGLLIRDGYNQSNIIQSDGLFGMGVSHCQVLASSMLDGNIYGANYTIFHDSETSLAALTNGTVDVLFGVTSNLVRNFGNGNVSGVVFSTPYYYGNQTEKSDVDFYAVMTRPNDKMFSSFVNCVVMSTIYASAEGIGKNNSFAMPTLTIFGNDMLWSLKDGIYARGSYEEIYSANFHNIEIEDRGRNDINTGQEPQLLDEPGLGI